MNFKRYSVTPCWIRDILRAGIAGSLASKPRLPLHPEAFAALLPLLRHGALEDDDAPAAETNLARLLGGAFACNDLNVFLRDARKLANDGTLAIRSGDVCFRAENLLTSRFIPPAANEVRRALAITLAEVEAVLEAMRGKTVDIAICAMLGAQVLLTIHPFRDGNGRTARMFLAAKILRHLGPAPSALLGMLLMHRSGAHQYHQVAWALRAGDVEPMVDLFVDAERLAHDRFIKDMPDGEVPAGFLAECREELRLLL